MSNEPHFISYKEALFFHDKEIKNAGGTKEIRNPKSLEAAINAPKAFYNGQYLKDLYEMAATYVESICTHHPFLDGNKRTATVCALVFLYLNGYEIEEKYDEELADKVLALVTHKIEKKNLADYFKNRSKPIH